MELYCSSFSDECVIILSPSIVRHAIVYNRYTCIIIVFRFAVKEPAAANTRNGIIISVIERLYNSPCATAIIPIYTKILAAAVTTAAIRITLNPSIMHQRAAENPLSLSFSLTCERASSFRIPSIYSLRESAYKVRWLTRSRAQARTPGTRGLYHNNARCNAPEKRAREDSSRPLPL